MGLIANLQPTNFLEEKTRFLEDPTFNPQFSYLQRFSQEDLSEHGLPNEEHKDLAEKIVDATFSRFTAEQLENQKGELLSQEYVTRALKSFLSQHGNLDRRFEILWSEDFISRAAVNADTIKLRLPCTIHEEDLDGLIYHEIGTHVLRRINYEQQPWFKRKKRYGFGSYLKTEEGLAVLHSLYPQKYPLAYMAALNFLATLKAQESSFLEIWQFLKHYLADDERAFTLAFKKKRGLTDTSQPGGFTKDYVYFEGFVETVRFMVENNFPMKALYLGKLAFQDTQKAIDLNPRFEPLLPQFYTDNPEKYQETVTTIAQENFLI